ncbi:MULTISPECIES: hypothetical protein [Rhodococcus]|jgi:hypothetical protein|uniref:hypothetical protein n=2 Tax=Rhodococcus TaxID=1827 RepID=UPI001C4E51A7|nr:MULTISPECIES: hypothetical protein [Rhodococcus]MBW0288844.1 hypothetical protein [Rhodococcus sp. MH15]MCY4669534.1 hypothetical protein [Rhodococcus sp. (in: high G+C Gram-positive bacteria)]
MQEHDPLGRMDFPLIRSLARMSGMFIRSGLIFLALFVAASLIAQETPGQWAVGAFVVLWLGFGLTLRWLSVSRFTDL